ncbi:MAG: Ig-like domain-containing protein [Gemmatimonadaceae bacterium]
MQLFSRNKALIALSLGALTALGACGDDVTVSEPAPTPVTVAITPPSASMNVGESLNFAVQISGGAATATPTLASCTSSNTAVATAAVSGAACRVTAVAAGNATVTAAASTGQAAAAAITVNAPAAAISGLTLSPTTSNIAVGQSVTIVPTVNRAGSAVTVAYTYTSSSNAIATVNASGVVTAVAPGVATITVSATGTGTGFSSATLTGAATVTVAALPQGITALNVQPTSLAIALGSTAQLAASAQQPTGAAAATITYGTTVPSVATVSATGLVTAVAPGTAVITVTATSAANANFAASTLTQLVPVTVSPSANVTIQTITQGPIVTSYVEATSGSALQAGIVTATNAQVNQPIDITNVRDQIQVTANLQPNGQRVDSVVVFIANADGSGRRAAARQLFSNGTANAGDINLFVNTADFAANFTAGTADVFYPNGQKLISVSVFTTEGTTAREIQNAQNNRQTVNFNNIDGYAAQYTNPTRTANNPANGFNWWGGPGAEGQGSATIVPVFYTAGRQITALTLGMRQGLTFTTAICDQAGQATATLSGQGVSTESYTAAPFRATYNANIGRMTSSGTATSTAWSSAGNGNIECRGYEHPAAQQQNVMGVVAATDNQNNNAPLVTFAEGYRFSTAVGRPMANRLDYAAPVTPEPDIRRANPSVTGTPAITGWVNAAFSIASNTNTASTDAGVGPSGTRNWFYRGCAAGNTGGSDTLSVSFDGTGNTVPECAANALGGWDGATFTASGGTGAYGIRTRGPFRAYFVETDRLLNSAESPASQQFGVDKTLPAIRWTANTSADTTIGNFSFSNDVLDERAGFIDASLDATAIQKNSDGTNGTLSVTTRGSQQVLVSRGAGVITNTTNRTNCWNLNTLTPVVVLDGNSNAVSAGATFNSAPTCSFFALPANQIAGTLSDGWRSAYTFTTATDGIYHYATRVFDRAGNATETVRRRAIKDNTGSAPVVADLNVPLSIDRNTNPTFPVTTSDNVEIRGNNVTLSYGSAIPSSFPLVYPKQLIDARFNDVVNSPLVRDVTVPLPTPFVVSVQSSGGTTPTTSTTAGTNLTSITARMFDPENASTASPTITFGSTVFNTQNGFGAVNPASAPLFSQWAVLPSTAAGWNAPEGLKAQLRSSTNVTNSPFSRVDFYRLNGSQYEYLASATTPAAADQGSERNWTYTVASSSFANTPTALQTIQRPVQVGDAIIAIGVRSNGAGLVTPAGVIGGNALNLTIAGLPAGGAGSVTITDGAGFTTTATASGIVSLPAAGTYFVTGNAVTVNSVAYGPTSGTQTITVNGLASATVTYGIAATQINVTTTGLFSGSGSYTVAGPGGYSASFTDANGTRTINVPAAGSYTITATATQTIGGLQYGVAVSASPVTVVVGSTPATSTLTYTQQTLRLNVAITAPTGVTPNVSVSCTGGAGFASGTIASTGTTLLTTGNTATDNNATCTTTAAAVTVGGLTYTASISQANASTSSTIPTATVTYALVQPTITVNLGSIGGAPNNLPNGIAYSVRVTSSAYSSTGGFIDVPGVTGTPLVINAPVNGTYNVSINRILTLNTQTWRIEATADVTTTGGATVGTVNAGMVAGDFALSPNPRPNAIVSGIVLTGSATATDYQAVVNFGFTGPLP